MDFRQQHKINSIVPKNFQNRPQTVMPHQMRQAFPSQARANYQNINHPYLHSMPSLPQNQLMTSYGNQDFFKQSSFQQQQPLEMQHSIQSVPMQSQYSGGDMNQNFIQKSHSCDQPFIPDSGVCCPSNSFQHQPPEMQYREHHEEDEEVEATEENDPSMAIEFFQCSPPPPNATKHKNPFKSVMESMQHFSMTKPEKKCLKLSAVNHQTFSFKHDEEDKEEDKEEEIPDLTQQKMYRSHTRIVSIPNGVKIITEILKEENDTDATDNEEMLKKCQKWMNKQIEISVESDETLKTSENFEK